MITLSNENEHEGFLKDLIPDLTPMLDILFILLVFFMLAVGQVYQTMDLTLPQSTAQEIQSTAMADMIVLSIGDGETDYALNDKSFSDIEDFKTEILKAVSEHPDYKLVVAGDRSVSLERVLNILTFLNDNGIQTANILMQPGETP